MSVTSDIGTALANRLLSCGWQVTGTFRSTSIGAEELSSRGVSLVHCDLEDQESIAKAAATLSGRGNWDALVFCAGTLTPIGSFADVDFTDWEASVSVNLLSQMQLLHLLLDRARTDRETPCALFFAGGGTNTAPRRFSAYTVSKIGLIKMCELLDAEIPSVKFTILGPGWVKTKIHAETLSAKEKAGDAYEKTLAMMAGSDWVAMERVVDCCMWVIGAPKEIVGGRNFSVAHDSWDTLELRGRLLQDRGMYKLRRSGNDWQETRSAEVNS